MARLTAAITTRQKRKKQYCFEYRQLLFALMLSPPFCRRGEARALHWEDIYDGKIHVRRQYDHDHWKLTGERFKDSTKTGKDRIVPLNDWVGRALMPVWERQGRPATGHIFVSRWGGPVALNRLFFYTMRKAGLVAASGGARAKIRLHDLRGIGETTVPILRRQSQAGGSVGRSLRGDIAECIRATIARGRAINPRRRPRHSQHRPEDACPAGENCLQVAAGLLQGGYKAG